MSSLKGPKHSGANIKVMEMMEDNTARDAPTTVVKGNNGIGRAKPRRKRNLRRNATTRYVLLTP